MRELAKNSCEKIIDRAKHAMPIAQGERVQKMEIHQVLGGISPEAFYHWVRTTMPFCFSERGSGQSRSRSKIQV